MLDRLRAWLGRHPWYVGATFVFCAFMALVYSPFDILIKPLYQDVALAEDVWFGFELRGMQAKLTEPLHWAIYGTLTWGFWKERPWVWPLATIYVAQVALAMLVWNLREEDGGGWIMGLGAFAIFAALAVALWRARPRAAS